MKILSALDVQVGGTHYKSLKIQPMEYSMANNLDACQHTAIKYVTRHSFKGGLEDLEKAKHAIDMLIDFTYNVPSSLQNHTITPTEPDEVR